MTRPGLYLCGCDPLTKIVRFGGKRFDKQDFEVCPEHGERMYGWASPDLDSRGKPDYSTKSLSRKPLELNFNDHIKPDNRDPVLVYAFMKAVEEDESIPKTNGHIST